MESGLIHESPSGEYSIMDNDAASTSYSGSVAPAPNYEPAGETTSTAGSSSLNSHLDSVFASSGFTREDVLVIAGGAQIVLWLALLYLEVQKR